MEPSNQNKHGLYGESAYPPIFDNEPPPLDDYEDDFGDFGNFATFENTENINADEKWSSWSNLSVPIEDTKKTNKSTDDTKHNETYQNGVNKNVSDIENFASQKKSKGNDEIEDRNNAGEEGKVKLTSNCDESKSFEIHQLKAENGKDSNDISIQKSIFEVQNESDDNYQGNEKVSKGISNDTVTTVHKNVIQTSGQCLESQGFDQLDEDANCQSGNDHIEKKTLGVSKNYEQCDNQKETRSLNVSDNFGDFAEFQSNSMYEETFGEAIEVNSKAEGNQDATNVLKVFEKSVFMENEEESKDEISERTIKSNTSNFSERNNDNSIFDFKNADVDLHVEKNKLTSANAPENSATQTSSSQGNIASSLDGKNKVDTLDFDTDEFDQFQKSSEKQEHFDVDRQLKDMHSDFEDNSVCEVVDSSKHLNTNKEEQDVVMNFPKKAPTTNEISEISLANSLSNKSNDEEIEQFDTDFDEDFDTFQEYSHKPVDGQDQSCDHISSMIEPTGSSQRDEWASFQTQTASKKNNVKKEIVNLEFNESVDKDTDNQDSKYAELVSEEMKKNKDEEFHDFQDFEANRENGGFSKEGSLEIGFKENSFAEDSSEGLNTNMLENEPKSNMFQTTSSGYNKDDFDDFQSNNAHSSVSSKKKEDEFKLSSGCDEEGFDDFQNFSAQTAISLKEEEKVFQSSSGANEEDFSDFQNLDAHTAISSIEDKNEFKPFSGTNEEDIDDIQNFNAQTAISSKEEENDFQQSSGAKDFDDFQNFNAQSSISFKEENNEFKPSSGTNEEDFDDFQNFNAQSSISFKGENNEFKPSSGTNEEDFDDFQKISTQTAISSKAEDNNFQPSSKCNQEDFDDFQDFNVHTPVFSKTKDVNHENQADGWAAFSSSTDQNKSVNIQGKLDSFSSWPAEQNQTDVSLKDDWAAFGSSSDSSLETKKAPEESYSFGSFEKPENISKARREDKAFNQTKTANSSVLLSPCFPRPGETLLSQTEHSNLETSLIDIENQRSGGVWGALTLGKEEEVNWNVSFNSSTNFKSMLVSMNLTFEGIKKKLKKSSFSSLSPTSSIASFDAENSSDQFQILMPEPAVKMTSLLKPTLLAQSQQKELKLQRVPSISSLKKGDSGSETTSETASLDLDFFSSGVAAGSASLPNKDSSTSLNKNDLFGVNWGGEEETLASTESSTADFSSSTYAAQQQNLATRSDSNPSSLPFNLEALNEMRSEDEISSEAKKFLDSLESLKFMTSTVLMFPSQFSGGD
ncbi:dentin sialophosphoprotein-like isoform X1 [Rhopilema esculentum]|uniref:dentin sialophosphoprotein-like isoform X1 n=1 Tax=Rhopilema esculentum TaxID=499914 RepID=UPI0031CE720A